MAKFTVNIDFEQYLVGEVILLNPRQAKYLLLSGHVETHEDRLLDAVTAPVTGPAMQSESTTYQATLTGTGAIAAHVIIEYSDDKLGWLPADNAITLSGNDFATGGFADDESWAYVRARLDTISGTGATITVTMGK